MGRERGCFGTNDGTKGAEVGRNPIFVKCSSTCQLFRFLDFSFLNLPLQHFENLLYVISFSSKLKISTIKFLDIFLFKFTSTTF